METLTPSSKLLRRNVTNPFPSSKEDVAVYADSLGFECSGAGLHVFRGAALPQMAK